MAASLAGEGKDTTLLVRSISKNMAVILRGARIQGLKGSSEML
jgi:hypothetical protein